MYNYTLPTDPTNELLWTSRNGIWEIRRSNYGEIRAYRRNSKYPIYKSYLLPAYVAFVFNQYAHLDA